MKTVMLLRPRLTLSANLAAGCLIIGATGAVWRAAKAHAATSPRAYCAKSVNDDRLRPATPALAGPIKRLFHLSGGYGVQSTVYRCAAGKVWLCTEGANLPCGKADLSKTLPGTLAWCKDNPDSSFIPMAVTGHDTIYTWRCAHGIATPGAPVSKVDARGFFVRYWKALP